MALPIVRNIVAFCMNCQAAAIDPNQLAPASRALEMEFHPPGDAATLGVADANGPAMSAEEETSEHRGSQGLAAEEADNFGEEASARVQEAEQASCHLGRGSGVRPRSWRCPRGGSVEICWLHLAALRSWGCEGRPAR